IVDYVLQKFSKTERVIMDKVIDHSARAVEAFIETSRFDNVMNEYNGEIK
ncbi:aminoacyl-tRNA hydrolase, partial [Staphylococcus arlettae]